MAVNTYFKLVIVMVSFFAMTLAAPKPCHNHDGCSYGKPNNQVWSYAAPIQQLSYTKPTHEWSYSYNWVNKPEQTVQYQYVQPQHYVEPQHHVQVQHYVEPQHQVQVQHYVAPQPQVYVQVQHAVEPQHYVQTHYVEPQQHVEHQHYSEPQPYVELHQDIKLAHGVSHHDGGRQHSQW